MKTDFERIRELETKYTKMLHLCGRIKAMTYEDALGYLGRLAPFGPYDYEGLDVFDVSFVLSCMFGKQREVALEDLVAVRRTALAEARPIQETSSPAL